MELLCLYYFIAYGGYIGIKDSIYQTNLLFYNNFM